MQDSSVYEEAGPAGARVAISRADILAEITAICEPSTPIKADEITIQEMAAAWGYSTSTTQALLDRAVESGQMSKRKALNKESGRECYAYRVCNASKNP